MAKTKSHETSSHGKKSNKNMAPHLLRRAGFGTTPDELDYYEAKNYDKCVDEIIHPERIDNSKLDELIAAQNFDFTRLEDLKRWWLFRMCFTKRPLEEKLALFWHGHFATSNRKVNNPYAMYLQNLTFRKHGMGNFNDLLLNVSKDPAMIVWLDNQQNRKGNPNENYAREIMELFALGIGNYGEDDIKQAAKAFTGWQTKNSLFYFNAKQHDDSPKTVLGQSGNFNGDDVVQILSKQPAAAKFISGKLVAFFACDQPDPAMVDNLAAVYMKADGNIRAVLKALFLHPDFRGTTAYHAKIKSPAELIVGTIKTLQVQNLDGDLTTSMSRMGQSLFEPPNVKGWDGGRAWISTNTMMERFNFATRITQQKFDAMEGYISPSEMVANQGLTNARGMVDYFLNLLVDGDVPESAKQDLINYVSSDIAGKPIAAIPDDKLLDAKLRGLVHLIMTLPTYQLA
jgi:uncharacterized protein (DUF1800 family)